MAYQPVSVWFDAIVPIVVLAVTVGVTIWLAYRQVKKQRRLAADRATLKFIAGHEIHNPDWRRLETVFAEQMSAGRDSDTSMPWKRLLGLDTQRSQSLVLHLLCNSLLHAQTAEVCRLVPLESCHLNRPRERCQEGVRKVDFRRSENYISHQSHRIRSLKMLGGAGIL